MEIGLKDFIAAVVTTNRDMVGPGAMAPVFYAEDDEHLDRLSEGIAKILNSVVHDIGMGTYIIVKH